jgi:hypothetical protein
MFNLTTGQWLGIGGVAAVLGYLVYSEKTAKAAEVPAGKPGGTKEKEVKPQDYIPKPTALPQPPAGWSLPPGGLPAGWVPPADWKWPAGWTLGSDGKTPLPPLKMPDGLDTSVVKAWPDWMKFLGGAGTPPASTNASDDYQLGAKDGAGDYDAYPDIKYFRSSKKDSTSYIAGYKAGWHQAALLLEAGDHPAYPPGVAGVRGVNVGARGYLDGSWWNAMPKATYADYGVAVRPGRIHPGGYAQTSPTTPHPQPTRQEQERGYSVYTGAHPYPNRMRHPWM